jgi:uncharacterized membrane protein
LAYPLEIALPYEKKQSHSPATLSREALLSQLKTQGKLDGHFMMLVFLSTIVAAIGLIENNVAVIIGAMVIAPLLGPNLALSLSTTLGQVRGAAAALSMTTGVSSVLVGVMVAVALLPPTVTLGICLGLGFYPEAKGAGILLIANIASVNLTAQLTMWLKGIKPRETNKQRTALIVFIIGLLFWCLLVAYLIYRLNH